MTGTDARHANTSVSDSREWKAWWSARTLDLAELQGAAVADLYAGLCAERAPGTARTYWCTVRAFARHMCATGTLDVDFTSAIGNVGKGPQRVYLRRIAERSQIFGEMTDACVERGGEAQRALIACLGDGAARIGEAAAARRQDFAFEPDGSVAWTIERSEGRHRACDGDGKTHSVRPTKGRGAFEPRVTSLSPTTGDLLAEHLERAVDPDPDARVFTSKRGGPFDADTHLRTVWRPAIDALYPPGHRLHGLRRHELRHAAVTHWLRAGVPVAKCAEMGGWRSVAVMLDVYAAVLPSDDERVGAQMAAYDRRELTPVLPFAEARR